MKIKVQKAVLKYKKTSVYLILRAQWSLGMASVQLKQLSALLGGKCYVSIQILAYPYFYASYARVTKF